MATRTEIILIDDLDGKDAHETIVFAVDGVEYEMDLSDKNAEKFRKAVAPYVEVARKVRRQRAKKNGAAK